jgi:hypothetical protein
MRRPVAGPPRGRLGRCNRYPARGVSPPSYIRCNRFVAPEDGEKSRAEIVALRYHSKSRIKAHPFVVLCMFCTRGSAPSRLPLLSLFPARRPASCAFLPVRLRVRALLFARPALHARKRINPNREFITLTPTLTLTLTLTLSLLLTLSLSLSLTLSTPQHHECDMWQK